MHASRIVVLSAMLTGAGALVAAQSPGWTPTLEIRAEAATPTGDRASTSGAWALVPGQPVTSTITASADLCSMGGGREDLSRNSTRADNLWKFTASLLGSDIRGYRVRLNSQFERFAGGAPPAASTDELLLKEGQEVTVETLRAATDGACHIRNVTIRARVVLRATDPAAQAARYVADVWLVHTTGIGENGVGTERRQGISVNLDSAGPSEFSFPAMGFPLPQLSPLQGDIDAYVRVTGSVRARMREDGQVDVDLDTTRRIGLRRVPTDADKAGGGATGHKSLTLKENETIAIDLPQISSGFAAMALTPDTKFNVGGGVRAGGANASAPVPFTGVAEIKDMVMRVNTALLFKGHKTQILIRLRKARD